MELALLNDDVTVHAFDEQGYRTNRLSPFKPLKEFRRPTDPKYPIRRFENRCGCETLSTIWVLTNSAPPPNARRYEVICANCRKRHGWGSEKNLTEYRKNGLVAFVEPEEPSLDAFFVDDL